MLKMMNVYNEFLRFIDSNILLLLLLYYHIFFVRRLNYMCKKKKSITQIRDRERERAKHSNQNTWKFVPNIEIGSAMMRIPLNIEIDATIFPSVVTGYISP